MALRSLAVGFQALTTNPLRTLLSTLGVIIGVAALVAVLALGDGIEQYARSQIEQTTSIQAIEIAPRTTVTVDGVRMPGSAFPVFAPADMALVAAAVPGIAEASLTLMGSARVTAQGTRRGAIVTGAAGWPELPQPALASGRWFSPAELEGGTRAAVVSASLAALLGTDSLRLEGTAWPVVGTLASAPTDSVLRIVVPLGSAEAAMVPSEWPRAPTLVVKAADVEEVERVRGDVERWLRARDSTWPAGVAIATQTGRVRQARQGILLFKLLMGAITGISLLVGGIGIMNVLLASVAERTREIGIRKATGARHRDIKLQFLAESVAITGAGSLVGVVIGLAGAFLVAAVMRAQTQAVVHAAFTWGTVLVAVGAAVVVGIGFGMYPALRAARLSPVEAIRHE